MLDDVRQIVISSSLEAALEAADFRELLSLLRLAVRVGETAIARETGVTLLTRQIDGRLYATSEAWRALSLTEQVKAAPRNALRRS